MQVFLGLLQERMRAELEWSSLLPFLPHRGHLTSVALCIPNRTPRARAEEGIFGRKGQTDCDDDYSTRSSSSS
jgi:hypothetical protein